MKKVVIAVLLTLLSFSFTAVAGEMRVYRGPSGYSLVEASGDTGIVVQSGLKLTDEQIARIIDKGESVPLDAQKQNARWSTYLTHIEYDTVSTEQAVLDGAMIKAMAKTEVKKNEEFNSSFIAVAIYILCMIWVYRFRKPSVIAFLGATFATVPVFMTLTTVTFATLAFFIFLATFATTFASFNSANTATSSPISLSASATAANDSRTFALLGIILMSISAGIMYFAL